jgi:hypothetical protein
VKSAFGQYHSIDVDDMANFGSENRDRFDPTAHCAQRAAATAARAGDHRKPLP